MKSSVLGNVEEKEDILCFTGHLDQRLYFEVRPKCGCVGVETVSGWEQLLGCRLSNLSIKLLHIYKSSSSDRCTALSAPPIHNLYGHPYLPLSFVEQKSCLSLIVCHAIKTVQLHHLRMVSFGRDAIDAAVNKFYI